MISIIVPVYNASKTIEKCVNSLIAQTYHDIEILLINDGSTDDSLEICKGLKKSDKRILVFDKTNGGVGSARNVGIENAKGDFLAFVDSDDWVDADYIEHLMSSNADLVVCGFKYEGLTNRMICLEKKYFQSQNISKALEQYSTNSVFRNVWCKRFKTSIVRKQGIRFSNMKLGEDMLFDHLYLLHCDDIQILDYIGYNYLMLQNDDRKYIIDSATLVSTIQTFKLTFGNLEKKFSFLYPNYYFMIEDYFYRSYMGYEKKYEFSFRGYGLWKKANSVIDCDVRLARIVNYCWNHHLYFCAFIYQRFLHPLRKKYLPIFNI